MMYRTNDIFNFVQDYRLILSKGLTIKQAHKMYNEWCEETDTRNVYKQYQLRDLLHDYFEEFHDQVMVDGVRLRSYFNKLKPLEEFNGAKIERVPTPDKWLDLVEQPSILDDILKDEKAQYSSGNDQHPLKQAWDSVETTLGDLDTSREHYTKVPLHHIVLDFDLKDEHGRKNLDLNLGAAANLPPSYAEVSRGGNGLHIHYLYAGDVERLANRDEDGGYEIKSLLGGASLRRRLTKCNDLPIATISSGLPFREEKVLSENTVKTERSLRGLIVRALGKDIHPGTKSNMDFIEQVLSDAYASDLVYDVSDMWDDILTFAMGSTNQKTRSIEIAMGLKLKSEEDVPAEPVGEDRPIVYFDCEVYPNLFAIGWIYEDAPDEQIVKLLNPTPAEVQELFDKFRLVGFYNRAYDAHILWARTLGYDNESLFKLSQSMINEKNRGVMFGAAYSACYADVYDYSSDKKSLKKWMVELGLPHVEMDIPWDEDVPEDRVGDVLDYMGNDVLATREVARFCAGDFKARQILAELSGLEVINPTRQHTEKLIFGGEKDVDSHLVYTDLHRMFPGYAFDKFAPGKEKSTYRGESVGEGGLVRSKPGMYENVALLDVASMHPTSIVELNLFGKYTDKFKNLMDIRLALKSGDVDEAVKIDNRIEKFVKEPGDAKALAGALKLVINSVYGYTAASFPNKFRDPNNVDNIVAKRGALFMMDLKDYVEDLGFEIVHIKTDSVKIPNATPELIADVQEFGRKYGYEFEHEATYDKFCLVNDAVYVAYNVEDGEKKWIAVGAQFKNPVVFKTLFSKEELSWADYVEVKQVTKGSIYLLAPETDIKTFVGKFGAFVPTKSGRVLLRIDGEKEHAVTGTSGYLWEPEDLARSSEMDVDMDYFQELVNDGISTINQFGSYEDLIA